MYVKIALYRKAAKAQLKQNDKNIYRNMAPTQH